MGEDYRASKDWVHARDAAKAALREDPRALATLQVISHLAYRSPGESVSWYAKTTPAVLRNAPELGVEEGMPVDEAMARCLAALPAHPAVEALALATSVRESRQAH